MVPAPGTPLAIAPSSLKEDPPRAANKGRVVLDVVGTPAQAIEIVPAKSDEPDGHALVLLCETPCAVNLSKGSHRIAFISPQDFVGQQTIEVGDQPLVLRAQLGYVKTHPVPFHAGIGAAALGGLGLLFGTVLAAQGDGPGRDPGALRDVRTAGAVMLVGSGVMLGVAWLLLHAGRTEIQPSAATTFAEPRSVGDSSNNPP